MRLGNVCGMVGVAVSTALAEPAVPVVTGPNTAAESLAELPDWSVGFSLPTNMTATWKPVKGPVKADVLVWTPAEAKRIRALILVPNNTDSKAFVQYAPLREVAVKHEIGIVYLRRFEAKVIEFTDPPVETNLLFEALNLVAEKTGIAEFRHAPWITFGKSSRGRFPFRMGWLFPERTIASISYHGETPVWPIPDWAKPQDQTILHVNANGQTEWDTTWYRHVRPCLLNYRAQTAWLPHQIVARGVGHGDYADGHGSPGWGKPVTNGTASVLATWDYLALYVDKAISLRVSKDAYPTDGPLPLKRVDPDSGYLIHPRAVEEVLGARWRPLRETNGVYTIVDHIKEPGQVFDPNPGQVDPARLIRKASDVPVEERQKCFWVADSEQADAWMKFHRAP
jgi:hypothetical protein